MVYGGYVFMVYYKSTNETKVRHWYSKTRADGLRIKQGLILLVNNLMCSCRSWINLSKNLLPHNTCHPNAWFYDFNISCEWHRVINNTFVFLFYFNAIILNFKWSSLAKWRKEKAEPDCSRETKRERKNDAAKFIFWLNSIIAVSFACQFLWNGAVLVLRLFYDGDANLFFIPHCPALTCCQIKF